MALARALVSRPKLILADEPTGSLDTANGEVVMDLLMDAVKGGATVVMATHSFSHADRADRAYRMVDGRLVSNPASPWSPGFKVMTG